MRLFIVILLWIAPGIAVAGAWPREPGGVFAAISRETTVARNAFSEEEMVANGGRIDAAHYSALYAEVGLTRRLTFGLDLGEADTENSRTNIVFLRAALSPPEWRHALAAELGIGNRKIATFGRYRGTTETLLRPGISWGYGFESRAGPGWINLDLKAELRQTTKEAAYKADLTIGVAPNDLWLAYIQFQGSDYPGADPALRLAPTLVRKVRPWLSLETALLLDVEGGDRMGVKVGVWFEF